MKTLQVLGILLSGLMLEETVWGESEENSDNSNENIVKSEVGKVVKNNYNDNITELKEKIATLSFYSTTETGRIIELFKKAGEKFNCAFMSDKTLESTNRGASLWNFYSSAVSGTNLHSEKSKDALKKIQFDLKPNKNDPQNKENDPQNKENDAQNKGIICPEGFEPFPKDWSPLKMKHDIGGKLSFIDYKLEHFVRSLRFDVEYKQDGTALIGKNIKGLNPLQGRILPISLFRTHSWFDLAPLTEAKKLTGVIDCSARARLCKSKADFFRRLKGCSMKRMLGLTGEAIKWMSGSTETSGCIGFAEQSEWVKEIIRYDKITQTTGTPEERDKLKQIIIQKSLHPNEKIAAKNIVWTFVMAELLERHDKRRKRNQVVRGVSEFIVEKLEGKQFKEIATILGHLRDELLKEDTNHNFDTHDDSEKKNKKHDSKASKLDEEIGMGVNEALKKLQQPAKVVTAHSHVDSESSDNNDQNSDTDKKNMSDNKADSEHEKNNNALVVIQE